MSWREEQIGDARLILGDCREVVASFADGYADMIFTDPPYGHNNNNGDLIARWESALGKRAVPETEWRPIANDGHEQATEIASWLFKEAPRLLVRGGCCCCCCCGGGGPNPQFARWALMMDGQLDFKQMIIWDKGPMGMGWHYRRSYETILVGQKKGGPCKWHTESDSIENVIRPGYMGIRKIIPCRDEHPTPKPPELARHFIRLHTAVGETVLDPFMGGGSTGVAAIAEGRKFIGIELEPRWFDMACTSVESAERQPDMFRPSLPTQETML